MKTLTLCLVFIIIGSFALAQHEWFWYNPYPDGQNLNDIWFTSSDNGWAVGNTGKLLHWNGLKWTSQEKLTYFALTGLWFTDENHGWAVGGGGVILQFSNGTWSQMYTGTTMTLKDVCFTSETNGWAVGDVRMHYDGSQWTTIDTIGYGGLTEVFFTDANHGWSGGFDKFYKYDSIGWNLYPLYSEVISVNSIYFTDPLHGWIGGYYNDFWYYVMQYEGSSWNWSNSEPGIISNAMYFDTPSHGWSCGRLGLYPYSDATVYEFNGSDWAESWATKGTANSLANIDAQDLYMVTDYGHILHHDSNGWDYSNTLAEGSIDLTFPDTTHGWAIGNGHTILSYENGAFTKDTSFTGMVMQQIHFADRLHGIACGWSEITNKSGIYSYSGNKWHLITDTISTHITAICCQPGGNGWFAGNYPMGGVQMYHLTDNTIIVTSFPGLSSITSLSFPDIMDGWACGNRISTIISVILRYQSGLWVEEFAAPYGESLLDVSFSDQNSGWAVGKNGSNTGVSYHFDGLQWSAGPSTTAALSAVHHPDPGHAYAVGSMTVYSLENDIWMPEPLNIGQPIITVCFPSAGVGWIGGANGGILSSKSPFPVGIVDKNSRKQPNGLMVYPNPTSGKLIIDIPDDFTNEEHLTLQFFNSQGQLIQKQTISGKAGKIKIEVGANDTGVLFVNLSNGKRHYTEKIVIK